MKKPLLPLICVIVLSVAALCAQVPLPQVQTVGAHWVSHKNIPITINPFGLTPEPSMSTSQRAPVGCHVVAGRTCFTFWAVDYPSDAGIAGVKFVLHTNVDGNRTRTTDAGGMAWWEVSIGERLTGEVTFVPDGYELKGVAAAGINFKLDTGTKCCAGLTQVEIKKQ